MSRTQVRVPVWCSSQDNCDCKLYVYLGGSWEVPGFFADSPECSELADPGSSENGCIGIYCNSRVSAIKLDRMAGNQLRPYRLQARGADALALGGERHGGRAELGDAD